MARHVVAGCILLGSATGCFKLQPVATPGTALRGGDEAAFDLTDQGRATLGGQIGPQVQRLAGKVVTATDSGYVLAVSTLTYFQGGTSLWAGEQVSVPTAFIGRTYLRRFDGKRTAVFGAGLAGGVLAFFLSTQLIVGGGNSNDPEGPPCCNEQSLGRWP